MGKTFVFLKAGAVAHLNKVAMLKINQTNPQNGFQIHAELEVRTPISVFVGKNGGGKSRFFLAIKSGIAIVELNGNKLTPATDISFLEKELVPHFGAYHDVNSHRQTLIQTIRNYKEIAPALDQPFVNGEHHLGMRAGAGLTGAQLHLFANRTAQQIGKKASELSEEEITLYFENPLQNSLGGHEVAALFNRYVKRLHDNEYNIYQKSKGKIVPAYSAEEFVEKFGKKPWNLLNDILQKVFDGKFSVATPDVESTTFDHPAPLLDTSGNSIQTVDLSTGEKTLLWLALSLFNTQYHGIDLLTAPKLLLLDEPDAYLHPKMVEKMYLVLSEFHKTFNTWVMLISHSPTTAALAPDDSIYVVEPNKIKPIDKDGAIAELLDGVPHISVDPENRRQVFVESYYDALLFQALFDFLKTRSPKVNAKISVTFVASGPKVPAEYVEQKLRQILAINDQGKINEFMLAINGGGNCDQVFGMVNSLNANGASMVRGLVDWDTKNQPTSTVKVFAHDYAYAIENVFLDPLSLLLQLHLKEPKKYSIQSFCGVDCKLKEWIGSEVLLQSSIDHYIKLILGDENKKDDPITYMSGISLRTDRRYLRMKGKDLERLVIERIPGVKGLSNHQGDGALKHAIVIKAMIAASSGELIPQLIEDVFAALQV